MDSKTPLYDCHAAARGKIVPFAGYLLPVEYEKGVIAEHLAVRTQAGLFDVSHMGELFISGNDALRNIQALVTNDCSTLSAGQVRYALLCNEAGGVVDDLLVYRFGQERYMLVVNAANRRKDAAWIRDRLSGLVDFDDASDQWALIALQGPNAQPILQKIAATDSIPPKYYHFIENGNAGGVPCMISRTGYTGEDGFELFCAAENAVRLWNALLKAGEEYGLIPCGLGARDTLRLEAGMPLYGHEMDENTTPLEAGLGFALKLEKDDFIGKAALIKRGAPARRRVGLIMSGRGIARAQCGVYAGEKKIGHVTSGTYCPFFARALAMALVEEGSAGIGDGVLVDIRGRKVEADVVRLPFYKR